MYKRIIGVAAALALFAGMVTTAVAPAQAATVPTVKVLTQHVLIERGDSTLQLKVKFSGVGAGPKLLAITGPDIGEQDVLGSTRVKSIHNGTLVLSIPYMNGRAYKGYSDYYLHARLTFPSGARITLKATFHAKVKSN